jgi:hypothetical protein
MSAIFQSIMTGRKQLIIALLLASVLSGCSAFPRYVISNHSDEIVIIDYSYPAYLDKRDKRRICPIEQLGALPETTLDKLSNKSVAWQKLSADKYVFSKPECSIKVAIIAGASVTFATHDPFSEARPSTFLVEPDLIRLNIHNEKEHVFLYGIEVFKRFERKGKELYVYNFP